MTRDAVADYEAAGAALVALVEGEKTADLRFASDLTIVLVDLYSAGARLPAPDPKHDDLLPDSTETDQFFEALGDLNAIFDEMWPRWDIDWDYFDFRPDDVDDVKKVVTDLANDLAETYYDVKGHLAVLRHLEWRDDAVWQIQFEFWSHTCNHVMGALRILHVYLVEHSGPEAPRDSAVQ